MLVRVVKYTSDLGFDIDDVFNKHSDLNFNIEHAEKHIILPDHIGEIGILLREGIVYKDKKTQTASASYYILYLQQFCVYVVANEKEIEKIT